MSNNKGKTTQPPSSPKADAVETIEKVIERKIDSTDLKETETVDLEKKGTVDLKETETTDLEEKRTAAQLLKKHGVKEVYKVNDYWFTNKLYAEESARKRGTTPKKFS